MPTLMYALFTCMNGGRGAPAPYIYIWLAIHFLADLSSQSTPKDENMMMTHRIDMLPRVYIWQNRLTRLNLSKWWHSITAWNVRWWNGIEMEQCRPLGNLQNLHKAHKVQFIKNIHVTYCSICHIFHIFMIIVSMTFFRMVTSVADLRSIYNIGHNVRTSTIHSTC